MSKKATATDAQLILQLYDLRREAEMRKARNWWFGEFWPQSADDFLKVGWAMGTQENNWLRQVSGYWSMAASFVLQGALNQELFIQPAVSGEMFLLIASSKFGRERLKFTIKRVGMMREKRAAAKAS
jgi:hypothetical protein